MKNSYIILGLCLILGSTASYAQRDEPPYLSPVPKFTFGTTLAERVQQLQDTPLLKRFAASRKRLASGPDRPIYHFVSPESRLSDRNGLSYWRGNWHLFYQA